MEKNNSPLNSFFIFSLFILLICYIYPQDTTQPIGTNLPIIGTYINDLSDNINPSDETFIEEHFDYEISLLVRNNGSHQVLGTYFNSLPDYVSVNDEETELLDKTIYTSDKLSTVTLKWKKYIYNCSYMFSDLSDITNINLTGFNIAKVIDMSCMFCNNKDLQNIEFGEYSTPSLKSMEKMFYNCPSLEFINLTFFDMTNVINMNLMFAENIKLEYIIFNENKTLSLEKMDKIFYNCESLTSLNLSNFFTKKVTNMESLFYKCIKLSKIDSIIFDISSVTDMSNMFAYCKSLFSLDLSFIYGNKYVKASHMFYNCNNLHNVYFNKYHAIYLNSIEYMFYNCYSLLSLNLSNFEISQVSNMEYMFNGCTGIKSIDLSSFYISNVINMKYLFFNCKSLLTINLTNLYSLKAIDMSYMFYSCNSIKSIHFPKTNKIYLKNVKHMFFECFNLQSLDLQSFDTSNVTYMDNMFDGLNNLEQLTNINFDISKVTSMVKTFACLHSLSTLDLTNLTSSNNYINMYSMFYHSYGLNNIYFNKSSILKSNNMKYMFYECKNLTSLDLTNFDTSKVTDMSNMFHECKSIMFINLTNFDTSLVANMNNMFYLCEKLNYINVSSFNTLSVKNMYEMFECCHSLKSLDLSNFYISHDAEINYIFEHCSSLDYINIYNFQTSLNNIDMFYRVEKNFTFCLKGYNELNKGNYLGLKYNTYAIRDCSAKCYGYDKVYVSSQKICVDNCSSINWYYYNNDCFEICPKRTKSFDNITCELLYCEENEKYYNFEQNDCLDKVPDGFYVNDTKFKIINKCPKECKLCDSTSVNRNLCISCNDNFYPKINDTSNINSYIKCYDNIQKYYLDNKDSYFKPCFKLCDTCENPEGYYLDGQTLTCKPCFYSCKTCDIGGNNETHNCISCSQNYINALKINKYNNCYEKCEYYSYFDNKDNIYYCTHEFECPNDYNKLITDKNQCIEDCKIDLTYKYEFKNKCYSKCPENTELSSAKDYYCNIKCPKEYPFEMINTQECVSNCTINQRKNNLCKINYINEEEGTTAQDVAINNIRDDLTNNFDASDIDEEGDIVIEEKGIKLTITSTENQKNSENDKTSTSINLGDCETKLKEHYDIPLNKSLYILKLDVYQEGMKIPKIEYEVYYNLYGRNLVKLNLSVCEDTKIHISLPAEINEDLDKYNSSSAYYNDICYTSTTDSGTDISLADRQNNFIQNNKTLCEENCDFSKYNYETGKAICSCGIKINIPSISDISIDKNKFFDSFTDINNMINYKIMKCYKNLFNIEKIKNSYGSLILLPIILFHFVCLIIACVKSNKDLKNQIKYLLEAKNKYVLVKNDYLNLKHAKNAKTKNEEIKPKNNYKEEKINYWQMGMKNQENKYNIFKDKDFGKKIKKKRKRKKSKKTIDLQETNNKLILNSNKNSSLKQLMNDNNTINSKLFSLNTENIEENDKKNNDLKLNDSINKKLLSEAFLKYKKLKKILSPNLNEINSFPYQKAFKHDKRTYIQYYLSLIKTQHPILFSFYKMNDYNIKIIKIDLFFIDIVLNYAINALFFNDDTMHQIYEDQGEFNIGYQITQIIYSSLISNLFSAFIKYPALTEENVLYIKHSKKYNKLKKKVKKIYKILNIKFILFCIISSLMLLIFFYYVACFCVVYKNTQTHLIKDSIFSFGLSLIYPFLFYLLPGILRIPSIIYQKKILYKISKIIQNL